MITAATYRLVASHPFVTGQGKQRLLGVFTPPKVAMRTFDVNHNVTKNFSELVIPPEHLRK